MSKYIRFTTWLTKAQLAALKKLAKKNGMSATQFVRQSLWGDLGVR